jgi:hypothetical protein
MKKLLVCVVVLVLVCTAAFAAADEKSAFTPLKAKVSLGYNVIGDEVTARIWPTDSIGIQAGAGFAMSGSNTMGLNLSGGMVIPMNESGSMAINLIPGLKFGYDKTSSNSSDIQFLGGTELDVEVLLSAISDRLSIASGIGFWVGVDVASVGSATNTDVLLDVAKEFGFKALELRYYF